MFGIDMRKAALIILSLLLVAGVFQLGTMDSATSLMMRMEGGLRAEMPDCPMGFVCPAQFESAQLLGAVQTPASLGLLIAFVIGFTAALPLLFRQPYAQPLLVFTDSGPPALRSVFKKE